MADFTVDVHELENMKHKLENLGSRADGISSRVQSIGQSLTGIKSLANKGYPNKIGTVSSSIAKAAEGTNVASMRIGKIAETYRSFDEGAKRGFNSGRGFEGVPTDIQDMLLVSSLGASKVLNSASMAAVSAFVVRSKEDLYVDSDKPVCTGVIDEKKLSTLFQKPIDQWTEEEVQAVTELYFEAVERALSGDKTMINSFLNSCFVLTTPDGVTCSPPYSHDDIISLTAPRNHGSYNYAAYGAPITARMTDSARMFLYVQSTYLEGKARSQYEPLTQSEYLAGGISSGLLLYGQEFSTKAPKSDGRV
ncbi:MAG: hypothetical protein IJ125_02400, partial [Atopobiaceae bacterium]|nr:hypothetical protein [Atopobiaceae bacterium]